MLIYINSYINHKYFFNMFRHRIQRLNFIGNDYLRSHIFSFVEQYNQIKFHY